MTERLPQEEARNTSEHKELNGEECLEFALNCAHLEIIRRIGKELENENHPWQWRMESESAKICRQFAADPIECLTMGVDFCTQATSRLDNSRRIQPYSDLLLTQDDTISPALIKTCLFMYGSDAELQSQLAENDLLMRYLYELPEILDFVMTHTLPPLVQQVAIFKQILPNVMEQISWWCVDYARIDTN